MKRSHASFLFKALPLMVAALALGSVPYSAAATQTKTPITSQQHIAPGVTWPGPSWRSSLTTGSNIGHVTQSSPTVAYWHGTTIVAVGAENGYVYVANGATGRELPGWPRRLVTSRGQTVAIESSPTIAWLNGNDKPPTIIASSGSTWVKNTVGEVEAFAIGGKEKWVFHVGAQRGTATGVISSAAVGNVIGNHQQQVVFGSWDHKIYVLNIRGRQVGFAYDNADTVWSSPALYQLPGQHTESIYLGSDASGRVYNHTKKCFGGFVAEYRWSLRAVNPDTNAVGPGLNRVWFRCMNQSIWSSPAVAMLNHTPTVVVGSSWYEEPFTSDTSYVFAFNAINGKMIWKAATDGPTPGSPAIGVIDDSGTPSIVSTSWSCNGPRLTNCLASHKSMIYAWNSHGRLEWSRPLIGPTDMSSPVLVPLTGNTWSDVLVGSPNGLYPLSGATGDFLFGTNNSNPYAAINPGCRVYNSPAVANLADPTSSPKWMAFEACGGPPTFKQPGQLVAYKLPAMSSGTMPAWPMFRGSPEHSGISYSTLPGNPRVVPGINSVSVTLP